MQTLSDADISIVLPAKNEAASLKTLLPELRERYPRAEIIVVDDGSADDTAAVCQDNGVKAVSHPYSKGNGAAVKAGVRTASRPYILCMDADGQHRPADIEKLAEGIAQGYDLVVGARDGKSQASLSRLFANKIYNLLASWTVGHKVEDLTSGFRMFRADLFRQFLHLLPNGFSYPTTSTMAFFRAGYSVGFVPIEVHARPQGSRSHIRPLRDGARFFIIIFRVGTLYSPLKMFLPISLAFFLLGAAYIGYTILAHGSFTNFGGVLLTTSVLIFLIGLVSEQITQLVFSRREDRP
jgi:glycosyltransferase involved in cell wall biosynthesis